MVEHSKGFRTGRIEKILGEGVFQTTETNATPFISIQLKSEFPIGFGEVAKEETNCLLLGDAVAWWKAMLPVPKVGDTMRVSYATMYVKNGVLCMRVLDPTQLEVIPQAVAAAAPGMDTFEKINASDFFRAVFAERKKQKSNG